MTNSFPAANPILGPEGEVQIKPGERVLELADRLATPVAPGDADRMQERQFDRPVLGEQGGGVLVALKTQWNSDHAAFPFT